jgi:hypothetical protein
MNSIRAACAAIGMSGLAGMARAGRLAAGLE